MTKEQRPTPGEHGHLTTADRDACSVCNPTSKQSLDPSLLMDNAACASQCRELLDEHPTRQAVLLNVYRPLWDEIERLRTELREMEARAIAAVYLIPADKVCGKLQSLRDKAKRLLQDETTEKRTVLEQARDAIVKAMNQCTGEQRVQAMLSLEHMCIAMICTRCTDMRPEEPEAQQTVDRLVSERLARGTSRPIQPEKVSAKVVPTVCGKPMPNGKGAGQCINVPAHEGECDDMPY